MSVVPETKETPDKTGPNLLDPATLDGLNKLANTIGDKLLAYFEKTTTHDRRMTEAQTRFEVRVLTFLMLFLGTVVFLVVWLTVEGRVAGGELLFLLGIVIGNVLAMVYRFLFPTVGEVGEDVES